MRKKLIILISICCAIAVAMLIFFRPLPIIGGCGQEGVLRVFYLGEDVSEELNHEQVIEILSRYYTRRQIGFPATFVNEIEWYIGLIRGERPLHIYLGVNSIAYETGSDRIIHRIIDYKPLMSELRALLESSKYSQPDGEFTQPQTGEYAAADSYSVIPPNTNIYDLTDSHLTPISPDSLINAGGNLLIDSAHNFSIEFPSEWLFWSSLYLHDNRVMRLEYMLDMEIDDILERTPSILPAASAVLTMTEFDSLQVTEYGNAVFEEARVVITYYGILSNGVSAYEWARQAREMFAYRLESMDERFVNDASFVSDLYEVVIDGIVAYRFLSHRDLQIGFAGGEHWVEIEYVYFVPVSKDILASFSLLMPEDDAEIVSRFQAAMKTFSRT